MRAGLWNLALTMLLLWGEGLGFAAPFSVQPVVFGPETEGQFVGRNLLLTNFADTSASPQDAWLRMQKGEFFQVDQERPNFGLSRDTYFAYFEITNPDPEVQTALLENNFGMADYFFVYAMDAEGRFQEIFAGGDQVDITKRHVIARTMNTQLTLQPGLNRFMVKAHGETCTQIPLRLWKETSYRDRMFREYLVLGFLLGVHIVMILYNAFLGVTLKDKVYFHYVLFVMSNVVFHVSNFNMGQYLGWILFGTKTYSNHIQLISVDFIIISSIVFSKRFLDFYKPAWPVLNSILFANILVSVFNIVVNNPFSVWLASIFTCLSASVCVNMLIFIGFLRLRSRYQPATYYLLGWSAYLSGSWSIIAVNIGLLEATSYNYWAQFVGGAIEVSLFSLALGARINFIKKQNHQRIQSLNRELQSLNSSLERQVEERTMEIREILKHLHQGIFTLRSEKTIEPEYSAFLETIFRQKNLEGQNILDLLERRSTLSGDALHRLGHAIDFSLHEDETAFQMNKDCFPESVVFKGQEGTEQFLEFDWVGIANDSVTRKILVSVRDTTEKRLLVQQISDKDEELSYIARLIEIKAERFNQFAKVSAELLDEVRLLLEAPDLTSVIIRNILINYHTLKGLTRTLGLNDLSEAIHQAETELNPVRSEAKGLKRPSIIQSYESIRAIFERYRTIHDDKLGRFVDPNFDRVPKVLIHSLIRSIEEAGGVGPKVQGHVDQLKAFHYKLIDDIIFGHMAAIKSICDQLDKPLPKFKFLDCGCGLAPRAAEAFEIAIIQLIRNALDHGLEKPAKRLEKGKAERGSIEFHMTVRDGSLNIILSDDGQGLMLDTIKDAAVAKGHLDPSCMDFMVIAQAIFEPSLSTKADVSNISGRGIGLEVARSSLRQLGGDLTLRFLEAPHWTSGCRFEFILRLPQDQFCEVDGDPQLSKTWTALCSGL